MASQPPRKILIAMDGSPYSMNAFEWFKSYFLKDRDEVYLLYVIEPERKMSIFRSVSRKPSGSKSWKAESTVSTSNYEDILKEMISEAGFKGTVINAESNKPGEAILKAAETHKIDIIIVGSRGKGKLRRTLVGSTSHFVMHNARIPTVICQLPE